MIEVSIESGRFKVLIYHRDFYQQVRQNILCLFERQQLAGWSNDRMRLMVENFAVAAVRHYGDAEVLAASESYDGAGHLIGFAAECALKHGVLSLRSELDGLRGHFPELTELAKRHLSQRRHLGLYTVGGCRN